MRAPILPTPNHFLGRTKIDTNYTGTLSANTRMILLTACGAGASGVRQAYPNTAAGGGSGAHIIRYPIMVTGSDAVTVTIGVGGASQTIAQTSGLPGTSTTVTIGNYRFVVPGAPGYQSASYLGLRARPNGSNIAGQDAVSIDYIDTSAGLIVDTKGYFWVGASGATSTGDRGGNFAGVLGGTGNVGYICNGAASYFGRGGSVDGGDTPAIIDGQGYGAGGAGGYSRTGKGGGGVVIIEEYM